MGSERSVVVAITDVDSEGAARAAILEVGFHPIVLDIEQERQDLHWHDFDQVLYVMSGEAGVENEVGEIVRFGPGTRSEIPACFLHRGVEGDRYRVVIGFSVAPSAMSEPIERPPSDLIRGC